MGKSFSPPETYQKQFGTLCIGEIGLLKTAQLKAIKVELNSISGLGVEIPTTVDSIFHVVRGKGKHHSASGLLSQIVKFDAICHPKKERN